MRWLDLVHRWTGGLVGLLLSLLGLSGAILVHRDLWTIAPHKGDALMQDTGRIAEAVTAMMQDPVHRPEMITFASADFGLNRLAYRQGAGAYADQAGTILTRWDSPWARPELWLTDFHKTLFAGETGHAVIGCAGLAGLLFVVTGIILWWRTRRTFEFRLLPKRMSRPAIVRQHRDLGIVVAPLLLLSFTTGSILVFRPLSSVLLGPGAAKAIALAAKPPVGKPVAMGETLDWGTMIRRARTRFPDAGFRSLSLPRKNNGLITLRMKHPWEWLPNGRTTLWFAADTGALVGARDASAAPRQVQGYNMLFPLHAGKVGGLAFRIVMTLSGIALTLLGSLTMWTFWFKRSQTMPAVRRPVKKLS